MELIILNILLIAGVLLLVLGKEIFENEGWFGVSVMIYFAITLFIIGINKKKYRIMKATKGQWKEDCGLDILSDDLYQTIVYSDCDYNIAHVYGSTVEESTANAKLIASAPELLEACIEALKHHQGGHSEIGHKLRAVIKKATE